MEDSKLLDYYANNFTIDQLSSEDILKLTDNYIRVQIARAFNISIEEFGSIKKKKGISNMYLENSIRDIAVILNYIDTEGKNVSNEFRESIHSTLIYAMNQSIPHREFYIKALSQIDFSKEKVKELLINKNIDIQYRLKKLSHLISIINPFLQQEQSLPINFGNNAESSIHSLDSTNEISINIDGEIQTYYVTYSNEKYSINSKKVHRKHSGTQHNYKIENEKKRLHGKIGEQIALEAEKNRLINLGLENLIENVQLVAQIDEDTTFDGLGYDLISFNEKKERICIEVKTSYGKNDKPFFISKKELELIQGIKEEHQCKSIVIYYVLIDGKNITIKNISPDDFSNLKLTPILYKVEQ